MRTIGLRAAPRTVTFAIYDDEAKSILNIEEIRAPAAFATPDILKFLRINLLDVLREFGVERAGIRLAEPMAQSLNLDRVQVEAVMQEAFASSSLKGYFSGSIATIAARLGIGRADFKPYVEGEREYPLEGWGDMTPVQREACLCAVGAANV